MGIGIFKRTPVVVARKASVVPIDVNTVLKKVNQLPPLSETVIRAMAIANDDNYRFQEFIEVIKRDGAITSLLLKIANSVLYGSGEVTTVDRAVMRIGMKQCNRIVTSVGMKGALRPKNLEVAQRIDILWRHSLLTASVASNLNTTFGLGFNGQEYTAALLHDIGRIILLLVNDSTARRVDPLTFREGNDILDKERRLIHTDHCKLGEAYAKKQSFPPAVIEVIRHHHLPIGAYPEFRPLVDLVTAADHLTNHSLAERRVSNYDPGSCPSFTRILTRCAGQDTGRVLVQIGEIMKASTRETREALRAQD